MKKIKLVSAIVMTVLLLVAVLFVARFVLGMITSLNHAGNAVSIQSQDAVPTPWAAPTMDPDAWSDAAYDEPEPDEDWAETPAPTPVEELVRVPVFETAEQLAAAENP